MVGDGKWGRGRRRPQLAMAGTIVANSTIHRLMSSPLSWRWSASAQVFVGQGPTYLYRVLWSHLLVFLNRSHVSRAILLLSRILAIFPSTKN